MSRLAAMAPPRTLNPRFARANDFSSSARECACVVDMAVLLFLIIGQKSRAGCAGTALRDREAKEELHGSDKMAHRDRTRQERPLTRSLPRGARGSVDRDPFTIAHCWCWCRAATNASSDLRRC